MNEIGKVDKCFYFCQKRLFDLNQNIFDIFFIVYPISQKN